MAAEIYLAHNLQFLRKEAGLSQQALANELDLTRSQVASYENGKAEPSASMLSVCSHYFNISVNYLLEKDLQSLPNFRQITAARINDQEVLDKLWRVRQQKIQSFDEQSSTLNQIISGLREMHKLKRKDLKQPSEETQGIMRDYENLSEMLDKFFELNEEMIQFLKRLGENRLI